MAMTDSRSNSSSSGFSLPHTLELPTSTSNSSFDVSVLSLDTSFSSFGSMSHLAEQKPEKSALRKRPSRAKFNQYRGSGRWNNPVDTFGSTMNTAPFRTPSHNRLIDPTRLRMSSDAAANLPCRKCSCDSLALQKMADAPVSAPIRLESNESVIDHGNRATAALNFCFRNSTNTSKNFDWKSSSSKPQELHARTFPPMVESVFSFHPPSPMNSGGGNNKKNPPSMPTRTDSIMELNILSSFECTCTDKQPQPSAMMPPPIPERKISLMDFDYAASSQQILPPPSCVNSSWSPSTMAQRKTSITVGSVSNPVKDSLRRGSAGPDLFLAMPPMTKFERQVSAATAASQRSETSIAMGSVSNPANDSLRRGSAGPDLFLAMPPLTKFERQVSAATAASQRSDTTAPPPMPRRRAPALDGFGGIKRSSLTAPAVPKRKESLMDFNDCQ